jgi:O-antigen/teichoic acid export membrane protein
MQSQHQHKRSVVAKNSVFNLFGLILPMLVGVLTIRYLVRGLGTDGYGILSIAYMVLGYFSIFDLGLSRATVKFVAENAAPENAHKIPELVWTSLALLLALGCISGALTACFVSVGVTRFFKMSASSVGEAKIALYLLCASMPILLGTDALRGVLEAVQRFDLVNYVKVPGSVCFYLFAAVGIYMGLRVDGIILVLVLVRLATACAYMALCLKVIPSLRSGIRVSRRAIRPLTVFGGWIMLSNITGPIFGSLERFMIASLLSVAMLTYYSVPVDLVSRVTILPVSIVPALFPYFSFHGNKNSAEVSAVTSHTMKYLLLLMSPLISVFIFFAHDILRLWLGEQFAVQGAVVMQLVALLVFISSFAMIPYTSVQALGRPDLKAILDLVGLPVYVVVAWWFMRHMGVNGAALAKLLLTVYDCAFLFFFAWKLKAFSIRDCLSGALAKAFLTSGILFFVVFAIHSLHRELITAIILVIVAMISYTASFWLFVFDVDDRDAAIRFLGQFLPSSKLAKAHSRVAAVESDTKV